MLITKSLNRKMDSDNTGSENPVDIPPGLEKTGSTVVAKPDNTGPENPNDNGSGPPKKGPKVFDESSESELSSEASSDESDNEMNPKKKAATKAGKGQQDNTCNF